MDEIKKKPALSILKKELHGSDKIQDGNTTAVEVGKESTEHGIMEKKMIQHLESNNQANVESFLDSLQFSDEEIENVASVTKKQFQCRQWYTHKRGLITASKAKNVFYFIHGFY